MYGLDPEIDISFLIAREMIQVAIGLHQIIFAFDENVTLSVEGKFEYRSSSGSSVWTPGASSAAASTVALLGKKITDVHRHDRSLLELLFSSGDRLLVFDVSKEYESYQITRPGETIVV
jgi:hypothetical protein